MYIEELNDLELEQVSSGKALIPYIPFIIPFFFKTKNKRVD